MKSQPASQLASQPFGRPIQFDSNRARRDLSPPPSEKHHYRTRWGPGEVGNKISAHLGSPSTLSWCTFGVIWAQLRQVQYVLLLEKRWARREKRRKTQEEQFALALCPKLEEKSIQNNKLRGFPHFRTQAVSVRWFFRWFVESFGGSFEERFYFVSVGQKAIGRLLARFALLAFIFFCPLVVVGLLELWFHVQRTYFMLAENGTERKPTSSRP